jgi:hypothetical protein
MELKLLILAGPRNIRQIDNIYIIYPEMIYTKNQQMTVCHDQQLLRFDDFELYELQSRQIEILFCGKVEMIDCYTKNQQMTVCHDQQLQM